jgi:transmembrane sensor
MPEQAARMPTATPPAQQALDPAIVRQAAEWMARMWSGEASDEARAACERWRASHPDHERAWTRLQAFEGKLLGVPREVAQHTLREPAATAYLSRRRAMQVLGLLMAAAGAGYAARDSDAWLMVASDHSTHKGEIKDITLPDGTRVVLGTSTAIDIRFDGDQRLLVLRGGEILVTTAPDPSATHRPFRVLTRDGTVRALGTRFTVRQSDDASRVSVFEGAVELRPRLHPADPVRLDAGSGAAFSDDSVGAAEAVQDSAAAWSTGSLVAEAMRLDEFVAELSRYRSGLLRCDPAIADLRVSGVFSLRDTDRALGNLTLVLPVALLYRTRYWVTVQAA